MSFHLIRFDNHRTKDHVFNCHEIDREKLRFALVMALSPSAYTRPADLYIADRKLAGGEVNMRHVYLEYPGGGYERSVSLPIPKNLLERLGTGLIDPEMSDYAYLMSAPYNDISEGFKYAFHQIEVTAESMRITARRMEGKGEFLLLPTNTLAHRWSLVFTIGGDSSLLQIEDDLFGLRKLNTTPDFISDKLLETISNLSLVINDGYSGAAVVDNWTGEVTVVSGRPKITAPPFARAVPRKIQRLCFTTNDESVGLVFLRE